MREKKERQWHYGQRQWQIKSLDSRVCVWGGREAELERNRSRTIESRILHSFGEKTSEISFAPTKNGENFTNFTLAKRTHES